MSPHPIVLLMLPNRPLGLPLAALAALTAIAVCGAASVTACGGATAGAGAGSTSVPPGRADALPAPPPIEEVFSAETPVPFPRESVRSVEAPSALCAVGEDLLFANPGDAAILRLHEGTISLVASSQSSVSSIAAHADAAYWVAPADGAPALWEFAVGARSPRPIAHDVTWRTPILFDGAHVYFLSPRGLMRWDGATAEVVAPIERAQTFALKDAAAHVVSADGVLAVGLAAHTSWHLAEGMWQAVAACEDAERLYVLDRRGYVFAVNPQTGSVNLVWGEGTSGIDLGGGMACADGWVYVANGGQGEVLRIDASSGRTQTLGAGLSRPEYIAATTTHVYWTQGNERIVRMARSNR